MRKSALTMSAAAVAVAFLGLTGCGMFGGNPLYGNMRPIVPGGIHGGVPHWSELS